jgi:hypothetical protein
MSKVKCAAITLEMSKCKNKSDPFCAYHKGFMHTKILNGIYKAMSLYISSPWNPNTKEIMSVEEYGSILDEFLRLDIEDPQKLCKKNYKKGSLLDKYKMKLCQTHAGNLFDHSQWAALQILQWYKNGVDIMEGVDFFTAYVSAFFHDIGKGGDCIQTTKIVNGKAVTWYDMYSPDKFAKQGDQLHPEYSGDMILGHRLFQFECNCFDCQLNFKTLLNILFPNVNVKEVALGAYMHWEFGKLNYTGISLEEKLKKYYKSFNEYCQKCGLKPSLRLLKLCIAVSCADIAAGTDARLLPNVCGIVPTSSSYLGKDWWVSLGMDKKYKEYRDILIASFSGSLRVKRGRKSNSN